MDTVTVITGTAAFTDPHTVSVETGDGRLTVSAETILINTGSEPIVLDIPGLRTGQYTVTSTELIDTTILPGRLAIIGGGYLGLEFARSTGSSDPRPPCSRRPRRYSASAARACALLARRLRAEVDYGHTGFASASGTALDEPAEDATTAVTALRTSFFGTSHRPTGLTWPRALCSGRAGRARH